MKYELTSETRAVNGKTLFRIRALRDFSNVKAGDLGGWVEGEWNLSQEGTCWVYDEAQVYDSARVYDSAQASGSALVCGSAQVYGSALVCGSARVYDEAQVYGEALVHGSAQVYGKARVYGSAQVYGEAWVYGEAQINSDARIARISDYILVGPAQSSGRFTTAFKTKGSVVVTTGCFTGTLEEFKLAIEETHVGNSAHLKQYRSFANFIGENFETP